MGITRAGEAYATEDGTHAEWLKEDKEGWAKCDGLLPMQNYRGIAGLPEGLRKGSMTSSTRVSSKCQTLKLGAP